MVVFGGFWMTLSRLAVFVWCLNGNWVSAADQPNIIFIIADDLGWYDVGFHGGNQIPTPNIDALAYNGIILNSHYVQATSTPSRAALLTGKYPFKIGMQGSSFLPADKRALPAGSLMPDYFKALGYSTHLVGKWHLGYSKLNETPIFRGFDHHFGFYNDFTSYYDYLTTWTFNGKDYTGFDLHRDGVPATDAAGRYATDAFTDHSVATIEQHDASKPLFLMLAHLATRAANRGKPLEAPQEAVDKFAHVEDANRRTFAAMVSKLDDSVGRLTEALAAKQMLHNSIVVFVSDNGAPTVGDRPDRNWGSNHPLRGAKGTPFEGGVRGVAFVYSPLLVQAARVSADLMHVTDWLPTLYAAAGGDVATLDADLDGIDQWSSLAYDLPSARNDIVINLDEKTRTAALRFYNWKLIVGANQNGSFNGYYGDTVINDIEEQTYNASAVLNSPAGRVISKVNFSPLTEEEYEGIRKSSTITCLDAKAKKNPCDPGDGSLCLYDIPSDPCEENDLAKFFPSVVRRMKRALVDYRAMLVGQAEADTDIEGAEPRLHRHAWGPWKGCPEAGCGVPGA